LIAVIFKGSLFIFSVFIIQGRGRAVLEEEDLVNHPSEALGGAEVDRGFSCHHTQLFTEVIGIQEDLIFVDGAASLDFKAFFLVFRNTKIGLKIGESGAIEILQDIGGGEAEFRGRRIFRRRSGNSHRRTGQWAGCRPQLSFLRTVSSCFSKVGSLFVIISHKIV
jgi:hypothetical protein